LDFLDQRFLVVGLENPWGRGKVLYNKAVFFKFLTINKFEKYLDYIEK
jgi:hypothetical protein